MPPINPYESPSANASGEDPSNIVISDSAIDHGGEGEKIGILHVMLFLVGLAIVGWFTATGHAEGRSFLFSSSLAVAVVLTLNYGAGVAAMFLAIWRRLEGATTFPSQFGHWALIIQGTCWIVQEANSLALLQYMVADAPIYISAWYIAPTLFALASPVIPWLAYRSSPREKLWQCYALVMIAYLFFATAERLFANELEFRGPYFWILHLALLAVGAVAVVCYLAAFVFDVRKQPTRDRLHWFGITWPLGTLTVATLIEAGELGLSAL